MENFPAALGAIVLILGTGGGMLWAAEAAVPVRRSPPSSTRRRAISGLGLAFIVIGVFLLTTVLAPALTRIVLAGFREDDFALGMIVRVAVTEESYTTRVPRLLQAVSPP